MNLSSQSGLICTTVSLLLIALFWLLGRNYARYKYVHIGDLDNLAKHTDKYKLYLCMFSFLLPTTEFLFGYFQIRQTNMFIPNIALGLSLFLLLVSSNYFTFITENLHKCAVVVSVIYTSTACYHLNQDSANILSFVELLLALIFSYHVFYHIKHFFIYVFCLFFVLLGFHLFGKFPIKHLVLYDAVLLLSFVLNYSKYLAETNIIKNLLQAYQIVNQGEILVIGIDNNGKVSFISENVKNILGCAQKVLIGSNWDEEISKISGLKVENIEDFRGKEHFSLQKFSCPKGSYKLIEWQDATHFSKDLTIKIGRDVTQNLQNQRDLQNANIRLETLLANLGDLIFVLDKNYVFVNYYNHSHKDQYLENPSFFIGKHILEVSAIAESVQGIQKTLESALQNRQKTTFEYSLQYPEGIKWFHLAVSPIFSEEGELQEFVCIARNITESKLAENKLIESNNRLRLLEQLMNNSKDSYCITHEDGSLFYINNVASQRFGIKPEDASKYKVKDIEEKFGGKEEAWQAHLADLKVNERIIMEGINLNQQTKEAQPSEICVSYTRINENGYVTATIRDISERKKNEAEILAKNEALAASEKELKQNLLRLQKAQEVLERQKTEIASIKDRFELAINGSNDGIWDWNLHTGETYFSPRWKSMLGYEDEELENNYATFDKLQHPDYKAKIIQTLNEYFQGITPTYSIEFPMLHKDGEYRWILSRGAALRDVEGKPYRMSGSHSDITEIRKIQSELKQLSLVAEKTTNGVLIADMNGRVIWANQAYLNMMQIPLEEIMGKRPRDVFKTHNFPEFPVKIQELNGNNFNLEMELSTYQDKKIWVEISNTIIRDAQNQPIQQIEIITDVTERKLAELAGEQRQNTLTLHNKILAKISTTPFDKYGSFENVLAMITEAVSNGISVSRASFWEYRRGSSIICRDLFEQANNLHSKGMELKATDFPAYFQGIESGLAIVADDARTHQNTVEFAEIYLKPLNIYSMLDISVRVGGELFGILCLENVGKARNWSNDDVVFARAIADVISLAIEADRRIKVENSLRESENNFRQINETIDDVFWLYDAERDLMNYISPSCEKILGVKSQLFYEKNDFWAFYVIPEDHKIITKAHQDVRAAGYYEVEYRIIKKGEVRWVFEKAFAIRDNAGKIVKISGICSDITQERATQQKIRQLSLVAEKATNGVLIEDKNGYITWANQAFLEMFEISFEELVNKRPSDLFDKEKRPDAIKQENQHNFVAEREVLTYTQKPRWVELNHTAIKDENDELIQQVEIITDITERKKSEQELIEKQAQLQQLLDVTSNQNQRLQNFAHIVSHNIRSHSSNLSMLTSFLNEPEGDEEQKKFFEMLKLSTNKLAETVENLNEIITIQNNLNLPKTRLSIREEIEKTTQALNTIILSNEIEVLNEVGEEVCIKGLASYIESILLNMLTNAIKYRAPDRKALVKFSAEKQGFFWVLSIEDNGLGIDLEKHRHKLFGMYKTFHKNSDARGIGLFITKNQIEAMGGKIEVESKVGIGTIFKIYFYANS